MTALGKILIIDDNPKILEDALPLYDYETRTATDGLKAMEILSQNTNFDIILLDVMMPNMSGWDVLKEIRQNDKTKDIPIIMITAINDETKIVKGLKAGADDYIVKPFVLPNLLARIEAVLRRCKNTKNENIQISTNNAKAMNSELTPKESSIVEFLVKGLDNKEIAAKLNITELTVKTHLRNIYKKLNVKNRTQLVLMVMQLNSK